MHGASRLALPRLPRTCFLPLAKLGPLRAPRWRLSSPQRRLLGLGFRVFGLGFRVLGLGFRVCRQCARGGCAFYFRKRSAPTNRALASACSPPQPPKLFSISV